MTIFRDIEIEWRGRTYAVVPRLQLLRRVEGQGVSLLDMVSRIGTGSPPVSEVALLIATLLADAGARVEGETGPRPVTEDDVYAEIMLSLQDGDHGPFTALATAAAVAVTPAPRAEKKPGPRAEPPPA